MKRTATDTNNSTPNKCPRTNSGSEVLQGSSLNGQLVEIQSAVDFTYRGSSHFETIPPEVIISIYERSFEHYDSHIYGAVKLGQVNKYFKSITKSYFHALVSLFYHPSYEFLFRFNLLNDYTTIAPIYCFIRENDNINPILNAFYNQVNQQIRYFLSNSSNYFITIPFLENLTKLESQFFICRAIFILSKETSTSPLLETATSTTYFAYDPTKTLTIIYFLGNNGITNFLINHKHNSEANIAIPLQVNAFISIFTSESFSSLPTAIVNSTLHTLKQYLLASLVSDQDIHTILKAILSFLNNVEHMNAVNENPLDPDTLMAYNNFLFFLIVNEFVDYTNFDSKYYEEILISLINILKADIIDIPCEDLHSLLNQNLIIKNLLYTGIIKLNDNQTDLLRSFHSILSYPILSQINEFFNYYPSQLTKDEIIFIYKIRYSEDSEFPELWRSNQEIVKNIFSKDRSQFASYMDDVFTAFIIRLFTIINSSNIESSLKYDIFHSLNPLFFHTYYSFNIKLPLARKTILIDGEKEVEYFVNYTLDFINNNINHAIRSELPSLGFEWSNTFLLHNFIDDESEAENFINDNISHAINSEFPSLDFELSHASLLHALILAKSIKYELTMTCEQKDRLKTYTTLMVENIKLFPKEIQEVAKDIYSSLFYSSSDDESNYSDDESD